MVLAMVLCRVMWPNQERLRRFIIGNKGSCFPARESTCFLTYSFVFCSVYKMQRNLLKHFVLNACTGLSVSDVRIMLLHEWAPLMNSYSCPEKFSKLVI